MIGRFPSPRPRVRPLIRLEASRLAGMIAVGCVACAGPGAVWGQVTVTVVDDSIRMGAGARSPVPLLFDNDSSAATVRVAAVHPADALNLAAAERR